MQVTLTPHAEELVQTAVARGLARSAEEAIEHALETMVGGAAAGPDEQERRRRAVEAMQRFAEEYQLTLNAGGRRLRDLIHEGHRY